MPRPVQITLPAKQIYNNAGYVYVLSGEGDVNLLATSTPAIKNPNPVNLSPFFLNPPTPNQYAIPWGLSTETGQDASQLNPVQLQKFNQVVWNRNVAVASAANLSGTTVTVTGIDTQGQAVTETRAGPNATTVYTTANFAYLTSVTCPVSTLVNTLTISVGYGFESAFIRLDYFYPNASFSVSGYRTTVANVLGGTAKYSVYGSVQKPMVVNNAGIPIPNPMPVFWNLLKNNSVDADFIYASSETYAAVKMTGIIWDGATFNNTTNVTFTVLQQGLRS